MSCRDATYLHGKQKEGKLTFAERLGLNFHLLYCSICRLFFKQLDSLEEHTHAFAHTGKAIAPLSETAKVKMKEALQKELGK